LRKGRYSDTPEDVTNDVDEVEGEKKGEGVIDC
jgi:hypothetical protein